MKVSIITPTYNQSEFIEETINSVLSQDYPDIEYIVLDDGSNDSTNQILMPYIARLKYIRHENMGESKTVNAGYHQCSGEIVGVINADDPLFTHDAVSHIVECFQNNSTALAVYPDWVSIDEVGNVINHIVLPQYTIANMMEDFNVALGPGIFIKSNALKMLGYRNESLKYTGDLDLSFRLALVGNLVHISAFLATHRVHSNSTSSIAQGALMAEEVTRLALVNLDSSILPPLILRKKRWILANAYFTASFYCGIKKSLQLQYICKSLFFDPTFIGILYAKKIENLIKKKKDIINSSLVNTIRSSIPAKIRSCLKKIRNK